MTAEEWYDEGSGALAIGDLSAAEAAYRQAVELKPEYSDGWQALGMILVKQSRFPEAVAALERATQLSPNDQMCWTSLSIAYMRNQQIAEAESASAKAKVIGWGGKIKQAEK